MKTKMLLKAFIVLFIPVVYYLLNSGFRSVTEGSTALIINPEPKDFENYILNDNSQDADNPWCMEKFVYPNNYYDELNFTGVHIYDKWNGGDRLGNFANETLSTTQIENIRSIINTAKSRGLKTMFERINISRLCYSQRLVYEIYNGVPDNPQDINYGFTYQDVMQNVYTTDEGRTVLHPRPGIDQAGDLCKNIYENLMHTDLGYFNAGLGDNGMWHVKPVMKINASDAYNNPEAEVVEITVKKFDGTSFDPIIIKAKHFIPEGGSYGGEYKSNYFFGIGFDPLTISGSTNGGLGQGWHKAWYWDCGVDFKVYWPGYVEVWFDKMVVDDNDANKLLNPNPAFNYNGKIQDELDQLVNNAPDENNRLDIFFADECSFSNISSIRYVQNFIRSHSTNARLVYATSNALNYASRRNHNNAFILGLDSTQPQNLELLTPLLVLPAPITRWSPTTKRSIYLNLHFSI